MGDWDLELPSIGGVFPTSTGWINPAAGIPHKRCEVAHPSLIGAPHMSVNGVSFSSEEIWSGTRITLPGRGSQALLLRTATRPQPAAGGAYWITSDWTSVACIEAVNQSNGGTGQGFVATTADGVRYTFDWMARAHETRLAKVRTTHNWGSEYVFLERGRYALYATRVEDRSGNWVAYTYSNGADSPVKLNRIESSDGRIITVAYTGNFISSVTAHGKSWSYGYSGDRLTTVTLPDTRQWSINLDGFKRLMIDYFDEEPSVQWRACGDPGELKEHSYSGTVTHPSGAIGTFGLVQRRMRRTGLPADNCATGHPSDPNDDSDIYPKAWDAYALGQKTLSGPGLATATWSYAYGPGGGDVTEVFGPGVYEKHAFGNTFRIDEGKPLSVQVGNSPTDILSATTYAHSTATSGVPYFTPLGDSGQWRSDNFTEEYPRPMLSATISRQGVTFDSQVDTGCEGSGVRCFDDYARPTRVLKFSSIAGNPTKTEATTYYDDLGDWVLGQVAKTTVNGIVASENGYDSLARPLWSKAFGKLQQTLTYHADGTVATVSDGRDTSTFNTTIALSSWKRGIPRVIQHPATPDQPSGESESAEVNDDGTLASVTEENGYKTCYGYDSMGRLNRITYPSESQLGVCDTSRWAQTTFTFADGNPAAYGMPEGHWRQTVSTGRGRKIVIYDALWRPVVEQTLDLDRAGITTSEVIRRYDAAGRLDFQSYPMNTGGTAVYTDTALKGTKTTHDALDRVIKVEQDWEGTGKLATTTDYLTGFQTRVTNPRGKQTLITLYQAFDQPTYDYPRGITHPTEASTPASFTEIYRDIFGKPTSITRRNAGSTMSATRSYSYFTDTQELCRVSEPETGITAMGYDGAGNLAWSASGLAAGTACDKEGDTTAILARKATRTYDARSRLKTLTFPGGNGNQTWTYTPDGLPASVVANNVGGQQATTTYDYNRRRLLELETLQYGTAFTWPVDYAYNANGHLSAQVWHGLTVDYVPDALGRPTQAGTFASGVSYHPNGAIKQFTYGNGIVHTLTQNVRQLPDTSCDSYGACGAASVLNDNYDYDQNGNVQAISDGRSGNDGDRDMVYDALDRLTSAVAPGMFGTATYTYDVLDNLTRSQVTGGSAPRNYYYCYDAAWRLDFVRSGAVCTGGTPSSPVLSLDYDPQGNLSARSVAAQSSQDRGFSFDYGNRLRSTTGAGASSYAYDGLGRRVWDKTTDDKYSQYLQNGQLSLTADERAKKVAEYVYLQGSLVAIRERDTVTGVYTTRYQHTDALGSPVAETAANRGELARYEYEPYGKGGAGDKPGYTGHVLDAATGLNYMQQRYYDPGIGRFLSVDPVTAHAKPGQNFNRYWYANNNPYRFTDPDGREALGDLKPELDRQSPRCQLDPHCSNALQAGGGGSGAKKSERSERGRAATNGNHRSLPVGSIDPKKWGVAAEISSGKKISVDSKSGIIVQPRSAAWPPTLIFRYEISQRPIEVDGSISASVASGEWFNPESYSSRFTGGRERGGMYFNAPNGPGGNRWFVEYPPQESSHDNVADSSLIIFTPLQP